MGMSQFGGTENFCLGCGKALDVGGFRYRSVYCTVKCHDEYRSRHDQPLTAGQRLAARRAKRNADDCEG